MRNAHGLFDAVAATRFGVAIATRARPSPSAALTEIHVSFDVRPTIIAAIADESVYDASERIASVRTRRSASRVAASNRASARAPRLAESACGFVSARTAHERTSPDLSLLNSSVAGTDAGSRGRKSAHVARHR